MAMAEPKAKVEINPEFIPFLKGVNNDSIGKDVNLSLAIYLQQKKLHSNEQLNWW